MPAVVRSATLAERVMAAAVVAAGIAEMLLGSAAWLWLGSSLLSVVVAFGLLVRRRAHLLTAVAVVAGLSLVLQRPLGTSWDLFGPSFGMAVIWYSIGRFAPLPRGAWLVLAAATASTGGDLATDGPSWSVFSGLVATLLIGAIGITAGERARRVEARRIAQVTQEREQLARDLHDVISHCVAAIALQADAAATVALANPEAAKAALERIRDTARESLGDLRQVIGILRHSDVMATTPAPDLTALPTLARVDVPAVVIEAPPGLDHVPLAVSRALFRVAQEAVTNALRHARDARHVTVTVTRTPHGVELDVLDDGRVPGPQRDGFGLRGMRERTALLGGCLTAGTDPYGGWRVHATVPIRGTPIPGAGT